MTIFVTDLISTLTKPYGSTDKPHKMTSKEIELIERLIGMTDWNIVRIDVDSCLYFGTTIEESESIKGPFIYLYTQKDELPYFRSVARKTIGIDKMKILKCAYDENPIVVYMLENTDE